MEPGQVLRLSFDRGTLRLDGAREADGALVQATGPWVWDGRVGAFRCDAIHCVRVRAELPGSFPCRLVDEVPVPPRVV